MSANKEIPAVIKPEDTTKTIASNALEVATERIHTHFEHDGKKWVINPQSVPSIENGIEIIGDVLGFKMAGEWIENESAWLLGNLVYEMKRVYGEEFDIVKVEEQTHRAYNTLKTAESVFCAFQNCRVPGVAYTHHKEVYYVKGLSDKQKLMILHKAREMKLNTTRVRTLAKLVAKEGDSVLTNGDTQLALMNKIDKRKDEEPVYIVVSYDGRVRRVKEHSFTEEIDNGSQIIIQISPDYELLRLAQPRAKSTET